MVRHQRVPVVVGEVLYGMLFVVALPLLLISWAIMLDSVTDLSVPDWPIAGLLASLVGLLMILLAMRDLLIFGQGLPMNPFPPRHFVTRGLYRWFAHPIYLGAVILSGGLSLLARSGGGLYIVTPILAGMASVLVLGYERQALRKRFGLDVSQYHPLFALPAGQDCAADWLKKAAMTVRVILPWLLLGYLIDYARCTGQCTGAYMQFVNIRQWGNIWAILWIAPYAYLLNKILRAPTDTELLHSVIGGTLATGLGLYVYLLGPGFGLDVINSRALLALVSFLVLIVAQNHQTLWRLLQRLCERIANSRRDWLLFRGKFRIINHAVFSWLAGALATGLAVYIMGNAPAVLAIITCGLVGAATYAQASWGSRALLRPFGFWGGFIGVTVGSLLVSILFHIPLALILLAAVLATPFGQMAGRLRCLSQGCCHGIPTEQRFGIRVWQPQSRVCTLSGLAGQPIQITQLYSILFNLALGLLLWALWRTPGTPVGLIVGLYAILTGLERFAEDAYRGETQTRVILGLKEPQWLAIGGLGIGILCTLLPFPAVIAVTPAIDPSFWAAVVAGGLVTSFLMSMDFPTSTRRFSRLSG